jgi:hypothetical protein
MQCAGKLEENLVEEKLVGFHCHLPTKWSPNVQFGKPKQKPMFISLKAIGKGVLLYLIFIVIYLFLRVS